MHRFNCSLSTLSLRLPPRWPGGAPEGPGAGGNSHGAGRRARPLGGGEAEDGLAQLRGQEGARARHEARAGEVRADPGGGWDDRLCQHRHYHEGNSGGKGEFYFVLSTPFWLFVSQFSFQFPAEQEKTIPHTVLLKWPGYFRLFFYLIMVCEWKHGCKNFLDCSWREQCVVMMMMKIIKTDENTLTLS